MSNLFSGLEAFGLGKVTEQLDVYDLKNQKEEAKDTTDKAKQQAFNEADILFEKTETCPVCDTQFKAKTIKTGKVKLLAADTDLRPKYQYVDSLKYDAIVCPKCGYASLRRFFNSMTIKQSRLIKENISSHYKPNVVSSDIVTYEQAINNHKLALLNMIVKNGKLSERAYTCLKTAWVFRGYAENLPKDTENYKETLEKLKKEELDFTRKAYEGFKEAFSKETFPMCGMDETTCTYLVADLARRVGELDDASRWISKVLISRQANERIKEKARDIKELIQNEKQNSNE